MSRNPRVEMVSLPFKNSGEELTSRVSIALGSYSHVAGRFRARAVKILTDAIQVSFC